MEAPWLWSGLRSVSPADSIADLVRFRAEFHLTEIPSTVPLRIEAAARCRTYVNGALIGTGPAKPSRTEIFSDELELADLLRPGTNVIAIEVLSYRSGHVGNTSVERHHRGVRLSGGIPAIIDFAHPESWRVHTASGRRFSQGVYTQFLGIGEHVDGDAEPHGWLDAGFEATDWDRPEIVSQPEQQGVGASPRPTPQLTLTSSTFRGLSESTGPDINWHRLFRGEAVVVPPHRSVTVDLDAGELMTAYLRLEVESGAGADIAMLAAECYELEPIDPPWLRRKAQRTEPAGQDLYGDADEYRVAGRGEAGAPETYTPFWFRTVRYLRLSVETRDEPLVIRALQLIRTHYPLSITGDFESSSPRHADLWNTSVRTLLNCMHDTFEDCPYYEQLQYVMDTRSQALFSLHLSTDDRLVRRAIRDFASSGEPAGLTESRAPSVDPQIIPGFSLYWVYMLEEHLAHVGDRDFTASFLDRVAGVLQYFWSAMSPDGFVISEEERAAGAGAPEIWNFVDWTDAWRTTRGVPDLGSRRANTIVTFQYLAALRSAARTAHECGRDDLAFTWTSRASELLVRTRSNTSFDEVSGYFRDSDAGNPASVHAQVWAVIAGVIEGPAAQQLLSRAVADPALAPCSYAASLSLFDALRLAGAHRAIDWRPWTDMLDQGLTTWAEDTVSQRSDCHAWGSLPLQHLPRWVLGVSPVSPGFETVMVDPAPSDLRFARGTVPTPHGPVRVAWEAVPEGRIVRVEAPVGVRVVTPSARDRVDHGVDGDNQLVTFGLSEAALSRAGRPAEVKA